MDITETHGTRDRWAYRRDDSFNLPWEDAVLETADGVPYLAPGLQLLYKSARPRPKDEADAREVIPLLTMTQARVLHENLPAGHPWRQALP